MQVQMIHRLPALLAGIHHDPVAVPQILLQRNLRRRPQQVPSSAFLLPSASSSDPMCSAARSARAPEPWVDVRKGIRQLILVNSR